MFEADLPERFNYLAAAIIDTVRFADEGNQGITIRGFVENHLRMAGRDNLAARVFRGFTQELIDPALTQNLQMGIRFVKEQYGPGICR